MGDHFPQQAGGFHFHDYFREYTDFTHCSEQELAGRSKAAVPTTSTLMAFPELTMAGLSASATVSHACLRFRHSKAFAFF